MGMPEDPSSGMAGSSFVAGMFVPVTITTTRHPYGVW
jgi:hypothetical protein